MDTLTSGLLFTLLLKVGVASSFAALLARWNTFRRVLFTEERDPDQKLKLMLFMTPPLIVGVSLRLVGFPYRQLHMFWRLRGIWQYFRGDTAWEPLKRKGLQSASIP